jgi:hypothetical protein
LLQAKGACNKLPCNTYKPHYKHRITSTGLQGGVTTPCNAPSRRFVSCACLETAPEISARYDDPDDERACELDAAALAGAHLHSARAPHRPAVLEPAALPPAVLLRDRRQRGLRHTWSSMTRAPGLCRRSCRCTASEQQQQREREREREREHEHTGGLGCTRAECASNASKQGKQASVDSGRGQARAGTALTRAATVRTTSL